jgi:hypothetical protein
MKKVVFFLNILPVAVLTGCIAPMEVNVRPEDERLVIYSTLTDIADSQRVTVQRTLPFFSDITENPVPDATVEILSSDGERYSALWDPERNLYITHKMFPAIPGVTYTLDVALDYNGDGTAEHYTATTTPLASEIEVESIQIVPTAVMGTLVYRMLMYADEPAGKDYYVSRIAINDTIRRPNLRHWGLQDDRLFDGGRFDGMTIEIFPSAPDAEGRPSNWVKPGDSVTLLLSCVDEDFFRFIYEVQNSAGTTNPFFGGPPYNPRTNISGGAEGYFGSLCSIRVSATVPE